MPEYRFYIDVASMLSRVNHLVLFSLGVAPSGDLEPKFITEEQVLRVTGLAAAMERPPHVTICIGGAGRSEGFARLVTQTKARKRFVAKIVEYVAKYNLDGIDFDWEGDYSQGPLQDGFASLVAETKFKLRETSGAGLVTVAVHHFNTLPPKAIAALDWVNVMAYDIPDAKGCHASTETALMNPSDYHVHQVIH
eukprot:gene1752-2413_t